MKDIFQIFFFSNFTTSALCLRGGEQSSKSDDELYKLGVYDAAEHQQGHVGFN